MDYLDPQKKKAHIKRLYIGYFLSAVAIGLSTLIIIYLGSGFYVDSKSGTLIQNGLLYLDALPEEATISLNGKEQKTKTDARLVIPGGEYDIALESSGYRPWRRTIELEGGSVRRMTYPRLTPNELQTDVVQTLGKVPDFMSQSIDRRVLLVRIPDRPLTFLDYGVDDLSSSPTERVLPESVLTNPAAVGTFEEVEWSENNERVLLKHSTPTSTEYIVFNRTNPSQSINVSKLYSLPATTSVFLRDRSAENFVLFDTVAQTVSYARADRTTPEAPVLGSVIAMKSFDENNVLFVTPDPNDANKVTAKLRDGDEVYSVRSLTKDTSYLLDIAKFGNSLVMAVGSPVEAKVAVYRNIVGYLRSNPDKQFAIPTTVLRVDKPIAVTFSGDASVVAVYGGVQFASHEFEADRSHKFEVATPFDQNYKLRWMDGARLNFVSASSLYVIDFDGSNPERLVPGLARFGGFYDRDYNNVISFTQNEAGTLFQITRSNLRAD